MFSGVTPSLIRCIKMKWARSCLPRTYFNLPSGVSAILKNFPPANIFTHPACNSKKGTAQIVTWDSQSNHNGSKPHLEKPQRAFKNLYRFPGWEKSKHELQPRFFDWAVCYLQPSTSTEAQKGHVLGARCYPPPFSCESYWCIKRMKWIITLWTGELSL